MHYYQHFYVFSISTFRTTGSFFQFLKYFTWPPKKFNATNATRKKHVWIEISLQMFLHVFDAYRCTMPNMTENLWLCKFAFFTKQTIYYHFRKKNYWQYLPRKGLTAGCDLVDGLSFWCDDTVYEPTLAFDVPPGKANKKN